MTYNAFEKSLAGSQPVELYEFNVGGAILYQTSAEIDINVVGTIYESVYIEHTEFGQTGEDAKDEAKITVDWDNPVFQKFINFKPPRETSVKVYGYQRGDVIDNEKIFIWSGVWVKEERKYPKAILVYKPSDYEIGKSMLAPKYGPDCQFTQFTVRCGLAENDWSDGYTVTAITGLVISVSVPDDGKYVGGVLRIETGEGPERAWIVAQAAGQVTLDTLTPAMKTGASVSLTEACRGDFTRCHSVFNNRANFLGAPNAINVSAYVGDGVRGEK
tara:strand:- start:92 stop:910 length:819 start_codon:yes stop_codon:yes gene_type:complete